MCGGLQNSMDLGETVPSVCSEEEDPLAVGLPAVKAANKVCYVFNIVVLTVVQACTVASAFWQCVVWCLGLTLR